MFLCGWETTITSWPSDYLPLQAFLYPGLARPCREGLHVATVSGRAGTQVGVHVANLASLYY